MKLSLGNRRWAGDFIELTIAAAVWVQVYFPRDRRWAGRSFRGEKGQTKAPDDDVEKCVIRHTTMYKRSRT